MTISSKKMIHNAVLQDIIKGQYKQDEVISERKLMERFGVSKSPVREALVELCNENVLRSIPRYGYEIVSLMEQDIFNVLQFRCMVECQCLHLASKRITPAELQELKEHIEQESSALKEYDVWQSWDSNAAFHLKLLSYCGNRYCYEQVSRSLSLLLRAYAQFYWDKWKRVTFTFGNDDHLRIVNALENGDLSKAEIMLRKDINSFGVSMDSMADFTL